MNEDDPVTSSAVGFPGVGGCDHHHNCLEDFTRINSFGNDLELDFIDGVSESEIEDVGQDPATVTLLHSVINTLTRKEHPGSLTGKSLPCSSFLSSQSQCQ